jgi:hypothetical protein
MAFTGQAKADYQREYMRRRRDALKLTAVRPGKTDAETEALKAEIAALKVKLAEALTLQWGNHGMGDNRFFSSASTIAGSYCVHWTATNKSRGGGEKKPIPEGESFEAKFSPWGKNNRRLKDRPLGTFPTLDEARAACQEYEIAQRG